MSPWVPNACIRPPCGMAMTIDTENWDDSESRRLPETALPCDSLIRLPVASRTVMATYAASTPDALAILVLMSSTTCLGLGWGWGSGSGYGSGSGKG